MAPSEYPIKMSRGVSTFPRAWLLVICFICNINSAEICHAGHINPSRSEWASWERLTHDNSSASMVQISTRSPLYLGTGSKGSALQMGYNEQQLLFEVYRGWGLRSPGESWLDFPFSILLFPFLSFFLLLCLSLLLITPNSTLFSLLYYQVMSRPWQPQPLQTVKPKHLHLATLRHIWQPLSLSRKGRFGESDPNLTHCSAPALNRSSHLLEWQSPTKGRISPSTVFSK